MTWYTSQFSKESGDALWMYLIKASLGELIKEGDIQWTESKATTEVLEREMLTADSFQLAIDRRLNLSSLVKEATL